MTQALVRMRGCETTYKETVEEANEFLSKFRREMLRLCMLLRNQELPRCEAIHSAISQLVVFETSAEMNNKYDKGNFAKLLEEFSPQEELYTIDLHLYGVSQDPTLSEETQDTDSKASKQ